MKQKIYLREYGEVQVTRLRIPDAATVPVVAPPQPLRLLPSASIPLFL